MRNLQQYKNDFFPTVFFFCFSLFFFITITSWYSSNSLISFSRCLERARALARSGMCVRVDFELLAIFPTYILIIRVGVFFLLQMLCFGFSLVWYVCFFSDILLLLIAQSARDFSYSAGMAKRNVLQTVDRCQGRSLGNQFT